MHRDPRDGLRRPQISRADELKLLVADLEKKAEELVEENVYLKDEMQRVEIRLRQSLLGR